ncbi:FliI/YscN family ATPase [Roseovarius nanhaiticus]|uniref:Flagellum-specific ATP synthase n=1 Tax=Roseovarius nanhaiticus TaxID=573024 RepID=A0A1N7HL13_9RHOB|nr:FliI/YscN family ATPase [Roseovarius nanhaiticus]SEL26643.1 flagellum-specific ATP synthase [Roseovarius nanhaiticus]SIS25493.1 flagellum-specific ATP synthase [Roseovarius nanhaiticus]
MRTKDLDGLGAEIAGLTAVHAVGRVSAVSGATIEIAGLSAAARLGDRLLVARRDGAPLWGEVLRLAEGCVVMLPDEAPMGVSLGDRATLHGASGISPSAAWIGRIVDPFGLPMDGRPLRRGSRDCPLRAAPPPPAQRRALGPRLETGMSVFNTFLPIVRGQRIGLFAGSGVGKSSLLGHLGRHMEADIVVFALIGERGRELREFVETVLGPEGMARSVVIAATSDRSALVRRRCAWTAMAVAEYFRAQGLEVLLLADSITRFAEAHREVATAAGEMPSLRGFPASTSHMIMSLCERAGPGVEGEGNITGIFSVLVAGSDMDEPVADILRGVLDGHVVMDRAIAERGRYPAIDVLRSVSRSLPRAATDDENALLMRVRRMMGAYDRSETMIRAGLYATGSDPDLDIAIRAWPELDSYLAEPEQNGTKSSFDRLALILRRAEAAPGPQRKAPAQVIRQPARPSAPTQSAGHAHPHRLQ